MPPSASSKRPSRRCVAPVNAPRSWPNSSEEISVGASAAQFTLTKARAGSLRSFVDGAGNELFAGAGFARDEDCGVGWGDLGDPRKHHLQRVGRADDLLEHRGAVHFVSQGQVLSIQLILERADLRFTLLELSIQAARLGQQLLAGLQSLTFELRLDAKPLFALRRLAAETWPIFRCASTRASSSRAVNGLTR